MISLLRAKRESILNVAEWIFIAAVASLVWRYGNIMTSGALKVFEALVLVVFVLLAIVFAVSPGEFRMLARRTVVKRVAVLCAALIFFAVIGHLVSISYFPELDVYKTEVWVEYGRLVFVIALMFGTAYLVFVRPRLLTRALYAVAFSSLVLWLAALPRTQSFFLTAGRLRGAESDPNYLATWVMLSVLIFLVHFLYGEGKKRWLWLLGVFLTTPLLLWTGSRGGVFAFLVGSAALGIAALASKPAFRRLRFVITAILAIVLAFLFSMLVLPRESRSAIFYRFVASFLPESAVQFVGAEPSFTRIVEGISRPELNQQYIGFGQNRSELAGLAFEKLNGAPLGLGPAYVNWQPMLVLPDGRKQGPHNAFLETGLTAGYGGLIVWVILIGGFLRYSLLLFCEEKVESGALASCFFALLISSFFLDMLTLRWLWLIMGFVLARRMQEGET